MYCICCKKDNITPHEYSKDRERPEEELLWMKEKNRSNNPNSQGFRPEYRTIDNLNVNNGIIQTITAGYGSIHDTDVFIIGICDECISTELTNGNLLYWGNYANTTLAQEETEQSKRLYRRRKNLDNLV